MPYTLFKFFDVEHCFATARYPLQQYHVFFIQDGFQFIVRFLLCKYKIIAGPRSALWLPYNDLGLIIADEEHDISYKQKDPSPRFQARDAAIYLASLHNTKTILGSATPSVESLYNAKRDKYGYVRLSERYLGGADARN